MSNTLDGNDLVQCPYNKAHMIIRKRFETHLVRCRRSYPNAEKRNCPFNSNHRLNKAELEWHVTVCPERISFERFRHAPEPIVGLSSSTNRPGNENDGSIQNVNVDSHEGSKCEENWDLAEPMPYNPRAYSETADVLRNPVGLTPSQRNAFRQEERKRLHFLRRN